MWKLTFSRSHPPSTPTEKQFLKLIQRYEECKLVGARWRLLQTSAKKRKGRKGKEKSTEVSQRPPFSPIPRVFRKNYVVARSQRRRE